MVNLLYTNYSYLEIILKNKLLTLLNILITIIFNINIIMSQLSKKVKMSFQFIFQKKIVNFRELVIELIFIIYGLNEFQTLTNCNNFLLVFLVRSPHWPS